MSILNSNVNGLKPSVISDNHEKGLCLETAWLHAERELKVNVTFHNRLDPYGYVRDSGSEVDNIFKYDGVKHGVECKNLGCYVGLSFGKRHIIERYVDVDVDKKLVVVSKLRYLGYPLRVLLFYLGFIIVEVGFQVNWYNFRKAVHILKRKLRMLLNIPLSLDCCVNRCVSYSCDGYSGVNGNSYSCNGDGNVAVRVLDAYFGLVRRRQHKQHGEQRFGRCRQQQTVRYGSGNFG